MLFILRAIPLEFFGIINSLNKEKILKTLVLSHYDIAQLMSMQECIVIMEECFIAMASGKTITPLRTCMIAPGVNGRLGMMPGFIRENPATMGIKVTGVYPDNYLTLYDSHQGAILLFDVQFGCLLSILDAASITAIRTAAASAAATKILARKGASELALLGSGVQAEKHLEAVSLVRELRKVKVWSLPYDHTLRFIDKVSSRYSFDIQPARTSDEAISEADIICTVTSSKTPVLKGSALKLGAHINAVGACERSSRELDSDAVLRSRLFSDSRESLFNEAGDFLIPLDEGVINKDHFLGELGELLTGRISGRKSVGDITVYKSLGLSIQDLACSQYIYRKALNRNIGNSVELIATREGK